MRVPNPRGSLSGTLAAWLADPTQALPASPAIPAEPLADDDFQLALFCCHELYYGGFESVDDDLEWAPQLIRFRSALEAAMFAALVDAVGEPTPIPPREVPAAIFAAVEADDGPSLSVHIARQASVEQVREFVIHRSAYQLKEADPHTFAIPRIGGAAKAAMVEVQADEYGGGDPDRMHSQLFAKTMRELGLDDAYGAYIDRIPGTTLASLNLISVFGLRRRWRGALAGHLAGFEITSPEPNRRYGNGLRRLGFGPAATEFFDEHVEADSVHENIAAYDLAGGLARQEPQLAGQILFGVRALLHCEAAFAGHILDHWEQRRSSLLPAPQPVAA